ncbi:small ribosomal subunit protein mS39 isoform 5-T5 [Discoglossus pictus]
MFQDDPFLIPKTSPEFRLYSLSKESGRNAANYIFNTYPKFFQHDVAEPHIPRLYSLSKESGRNAAKYIFNTYPKFFQHDVAEPHIPCLMPQYLQPQIEGVSEEALKERIQLRRVKESVDLFDQLVQSGTAPSLETTNCFFDLPGEVPGSHRNAEDPTEQREPEETEAVEETQKRPGPFRRASDILTSWREHNNAERIFNLMPERNAHSFCTMIRGMVKHGCPSKAFNMYTDLLNNRLSADVYTFNALIIAAPEIKEKYNEKWELITELLKHMVEQKVQPNLLTFNSVLKSLRKCGTLARGPALQTLSEMKALNIAPSLASYNHLLGVFYKAASSSRGQSEILAEILDEIEGENFTARDPDDVYFFASAMRVCLDLKDIELAYRLHSLSQTGDNWKLMGDPYLQSTYYGRFFNLLCMMENIDVILKWYQELIPSLYYPNSRGMMDLLQALEMDSRLDLIPQIWKDIKQIGHSNKVDLVEEVLNMMARDKQAHELQAAFADTAMDIKSLYEIRDRVRVALEWSTSSLGNITILLSRAGRMEDAWKMLQLFKTSNRVPSTEVIDEFLNSAKASGGSSNMAVDLVQLAAAFQLPNTAAIAKRVTEEFSISEEQRVILEDLQTQNSSSSSSSSESSDSDKE